MASPQARANAALRCRFSYTRCGLTPAARAGFRLEPAGFFDRNPTLDWPASEARCCRREG